MGLSPEDVTRLWKAHSRALVLYARQWCDTPEDIVQDGFMLLVRQATVPENPVGWLYRVVRNRAINAARNKRRRSHREAATATRGEPWFQADPGDRVDSNAASDALQRLPPAEREAIIARLWGGLTFEEIAELAGSSAATAYRCYQRGLSAMRERLGEACVTNNSTPKTKN